MLWIRSDDFFRQMLCHGLLSRPDKMVCRHPERIWTSHVERQNLNIRTAMRRYTRLTITFSKKWENLRSALAFYFAYYNFCRVHSTIRCTPAMAAGLTNTIWTLRDLLSA